MDEKWHWRWCWDGRVVQVGALLEGCGKGTDQRLLVNETVEQP